MYKNRKAKWIKRLVLSWSQANKKGLLSWVESNLLLEDFITDDWADHYETAPGQARLLLFLKVRVPHILLKSLTWTYAGHWKFMCISCATQTFDCLTLQPWPKTLPFRHPHVSFPLSVKTTELLMNIKEGARMSVCRRALPTWTCLQLTLTGQQINDTFLLQLLHEITLAKIKNVIL